MVKKTNEPARIPVPKAYKLYINGAFVRSESGKTLAQNDAGGAFFANYARGSRKDFRDAVRAARRAQGAWSRRSAFNRSQIMYRLAEMIEDRRRLFEERAAALCGWSRAETLAEVDIAVDRVFWYAGWADKFSQVLGSANPVAAPYYNFTVPEATGVVAILAPRRSPLVGLVSAIAPVIVIGNTCVAVVENGAPTIAIDLAEALATSDLPAGVVNLITGLRKELHGVAAGHMDVNAIACYGGPAKEIEAIRAEAADSIKRVRVFDDPAAGDWRQPAMQSPYWIEPFVEWKTEWHPIGV